MKRGTSSVYLLAIVSIFFVVAIFLITDNLNTTGNTALSPEVNDIQLLQQGLPNVCRKPDNPETWLKNGQVINQQFYASCVVSYQKDISDCQFYSNAIPNNVQTISWVLDNFAEQRCCPTGGVGPDGPYSEYIYGEGNSCCSEKDNSKDNNVHASKLIPTLYDNDPNNDGIQELGCCDGAGTFKKKDQICCPGGVIADIDKGCPTCCDCIVYHEAQGQSNACKKAQAQTLRCRQEYKKSPYDGDNYGSICDVVNDCKDGSSTCQYSGIKNPSSNYQQCTSNGGDPYADAPKTCRDASYCEKKCGDKGYYCQNSKTCDCKEDFHSACQNIPLLPENECPIYATQRGSSNLDCPEGRRICKVPPTGQCEGTNFYACVTIGTPCPRL